MLKYMINRTRDDLLTLGMLYMAIDHTCTPQKQMRPRIKFDVNPLFVESFSALTLHPLI